MATQSKVVIYGTVTPIDATQARIFQATTKVVLELI